MLCNDGRELSAIYAPKNSIKKGALAPEAILAIYLQHQCSGQRQECSCGATSLDCFCCLFKLIGEGRVFLFGVDSSLLRIWER